MEALNPQVVNLQLKTISDTVNEIKAKMEKDYVTQEQMKNLKEKVALLQRIVFGFVSLILVAVVGGWMAVILK